MGVRGYFEADVLSTQSTSDPDVVNGIKESIPLAPRKWVEM